MPNDSCDVLILGSGVGGSLLARILAKQGKKVIVVERGEHPRFAIGESSTPIADMVLYDLAKDWGIDDWIPLAKHGTLKRAYPKLAVGLKRGFSYFQHVPHLDFVTQPHHPNELLVAASPNDEEADSHWLRADFDHLLAKQLRENGIRLLENTRVFSFDTDSQPISTVCRSGETQFEIESGFIVDATGRDGLLLKALGIDRSAKMLRTRSCAIYGHFQNVTPWHDHLVETGNSTSDHPYRCDDSALHHVLEEGWMWQLRFDNGVTSVGIVLDLSDGTEMPRSAQAKWDEVLERYPSIKSQFAKAKLVGPSGGLVLTDPMQHIAGRAAGKNWASLPGTAGFVDPLHSTGLAHTICGVERLATVFASDKIGSDRFQEGLSNYGQAVRNEIRFFDQLVSACYSTRHHFRCFTAASMLYFAAATRYEERRKQRAQKPGNSDLFLCAGDSQLWTTVHCIAELAAQIGSRGFSDTEVERFEATVRRAIEPINTAGLCDATVNNMYRQTAVSNKT